MTWAADNMPTLLVVIGLALLALEVAVFGFALFITFFIGLACLLTAFFLWVGLLPATLPAVFAGVAVLSVVFAVTLWQPLKKMQNNNGNHDVKGDFIGHRFVLQSAVSSVQFGQHRLSGVDWKVRAELPIAAGTQVEVVKVEVGELTVVACQ